MKERLQKQYGSLRAASMKLSINYYRLSQIVNGWLTPTKEEIEKLEISPKELRDAVKR
jgi:hypothetical protein